MSGIEVISGRTVAERGANLAVVGCHFEALITDSTEPSICCDLNLHPMTWVWNTATGAGNLEATWESHHFFDPIRWEERLWGRVSATGGSGQLHMTKSTRVPGSTERGRLHRLTLSAKVLRACRAGPLR